MGKARTPGSAAQGGRKIVPVTHRHGGQNPAASSFISPRRLVLSRFAGGGARQAAALPQPGKSLRSLAHSTTPSARGCTVGGRLRRFKCKAPLHPLPGHRPAGYRIPPRNSARPLTRSVHPQHRIHDTRIIGCRHRFHFCRQCHRLPAYFPAFVPDGHWYVSRQPARPPHPRQSDALRVRSGMLAAGRRLQMPQTAQKKSSVLRQKNANATPQHSGAEYAERASHGGLVEEQGSGSDDILALCCVTSARTAAWPDGAPGLFCQIVQCLQGAPVEITSSTTQHALPLILSSSLRSMTSQLLGAGGGNGLIFPQQGPAYTA